VHVDGADRSRLLPALADVDAVLIRSATKIDAEALAAAPRLKVVARQGRARQRRRPGRDQGRASWWSTRRCPTSSAPPSSPSGC
jgi:hypothetical protein